MSTQGYAKMPIGCMTRYVGNERVPMTGIPVVHFTRGDITEITDTLIVHQTNCASAYARGLAETIFTRFPSANTYKQLRVFGSVSFHPYGDVVIVNVYGQQHPGKHRTEEERAARERAFRRAMCILADVCIEYGVHNVAFPSGIGCGLAGGYWPSYLDMIKEFAKWVPDTSVQIVHFR